MKTRIFLTVCLIMILFTSPVMSRDITDVKKELDTAYKLYTQSVNNGDDNAETLYFGYNLLLEEYNTLKGNVSSNTTNVNRAPSVAADNSALNRLHNSLTKLLTIDSEIMAPPEKRGFIKKSFAKLRSLFGASSEEDLYYNGYAAYENGDYEKAESIFSKLNIRYPDSLKYKYLYSASLMGSGKIDEANKLLNGINQSIEESKFLTAYHSVTDPYVNERVAFKIGGFDSIDQYREKVMSGNKIELHSDEYYEKYIDKKTWNWKSSAARKEFESIGGIDCGGLCQRVYMEMCNKAGFTPPFSSKLPSASLKSEKYSKRIKDDGKIPPLASKPGDIMFLSKHDGWGHAFIFDGWNEQGQPMIVEASGEGYCMRRPMPDRYYSRYDGTHRWNKMDEIREKIGKS